MPPILWDSREAKLSWGDLSEKGADMEMEPQQKVFLGELIVCPEYIQQSAKERTISFKDELVYVLSHGLLHLLGFSHGKKMYAIQQNVVDALVKKNKK